MLHFSALDFNHASNWGVIPSVANYTIRCFCLGTVTRQTGFSSLMLHSHHQHHHNHNKREKTKTTLAIAIYYS
jgi:hypothetical protein